jgi:biotin--protein ligase
MVAALAADDKERTDFLKACLSKLGLEVTQESAVPSLSSLHMSGTNADGPMDILSGLGAAFTKESQGQSEYLKDEHDKFRIERPGTWNLGDLEESLPAESSQLTEGIIDYQAITKRLVFHDDIPDSKLTPYFNHHAFYSNLRQYQAESKGDASTFGNNLLYGEVVTSTNTILEK